MKELNIKYLLSCKTCWFQKDCGGTIEVIPGEPRKKTREECYKYQMQIRNEWEQDNNLADCLHENWGDR